MAFRIGPHAFTLTDARRTLGLADTIGEHWEVARDPAVVAPFRARVRAAVSGLDPAHAPEGALAAPLEELWALLLGFGGELRRAGHLPPATTGSVQGLHRSDGGVPKQAVGTADVDHGGVRGDRQAARVHHGRPWQALCIWSADVIAELVAEGHGLFPGAAGENVTVAGIPWDLVRPGVRLRLGTVLAEVSAYAIPCAKNARWFTDGAYERMHHDRGPVSRVYATVLEPGVVAVGDPAVLEPPPGSDTSSR